LSHAWLSNDGQECAYSNWRRWRPDHWPEHSAND